MSQSVTSYPETFLSSAALGKTFPPFRKTFTYEGLFIDEFHERLNDLSRSGLLKGPIPGSLRQADALKLYELAYFSSGPVLELGTYHGLSAWIIASAIKNKGEARTFISIDLRPESTASGAANLQKLGLSEKVDFITAEGAAGIRQSRGQLAGCGFAFVDHSHTYEHVTTAIDALRTIMAPKSFLLFHDFNDSRNSDSTNSNFGVYEAVLKSALSGDLGFLGIFGCTGLYQFEEKRGTA